MGKLSFPLAAVKAEWEAARAASQHCHPYTGERGPPALWLVGDQGVYLMGNDKGRVPEKDGGRPVVYARECDPTKLAFDDWWEAKHSIFGGDDGVEELSGPAIGQWIEAAERFGHSSLVLKIGPNEIGLLFACKAPV